MFDGSFEELFNLASEDSRWRGQMLKRLVYEEFQFPIMLDDNNQIMGLLTLPNGPAGRSTIPFYTSLEKTSYLKSQLNCSFTENSLEKIHYSIEAEDFFLNDTYLLDKELRNHLLEPENELEKAFKALHLKEITPDECDEVLYRSNVVIMRNPDDNIPEDYGQLNNELPVTLEFYDAPDIGRYLPVFSSVRQMMWYDPERAPIILPYKAFLEMAPNTIVLFDPSDDHMMFYTTAGIVTPPPRIISVGNNQYQNQSFLQNVRQFQKAPPIKKEMINIKSNEDYFIGMPAKYPYKFVKELHATLKLIPSVKRAWLLNFFHRGLQSAELLIFIDCNGEIPPVSSKLERVIQRNRLDIPTVNITKIQDEDSAGGYAPFYIKNEPYTPHKPQ